MTTCQLFSFSVLSAAIDRTNRVDDVLCGQTPASSNDGLSSGQASDLAHKLLALGEYGRAAGAVNGAIHTAPTQKRGVCRIHDGVAVFTGNVGWPLELDRPSTVQHDPNCEI